ncbi:MAG: patatin-like phospholipase family protein [Chitinophagaceae bacterium]|nr:patatin-like phospholipase family protein [Chitinophagaceae bacterium]
MLTSAQIPANPLERIALSCSGGGYRAASFHLGSMSYLHRIQYKGKPLLENVKTISTVSGGTITGVVYALQKQQGKSFEEIYHFLADKLNDLDLVKAGIEQLNPDAQWATPTKHKNLINAFAELYDKEFAQGATLAEFNTMKSHLEYVVFNSTEFQNAINFRFRNAGKGYTGNHEIQVPHELSQEIKLGDVIASSACFPGGFEPMVWPHDYVHANSPELKKFAAMATPVGVMDGGIYDNQGIESILNYRRNDELPYYDLVIISDVASPYMESYKPFVPKEKKGTRSLTLKGLKEKTNGISSKINIGLICAALVFGALPILNGYSDSMWTGVSIGISMMMIVLLVVKSFVTGRLNKEVNSFTSSFTQNIPEFYRQKLGLLKIEEISVHRAEPLLHDRLNSLITLLMDVFLKVVRRLNYYKLYEDDRYTYRRISNLIKEMTKMDFDIKLKRRAEDNQNNAMKENSIFSGDYDTVVGSKINDVAEEASGFGTTLWFKEDEQLNEMLNKLIATGQFTMCYNMLEYLEKVKFEENSGFDQLPETTQQDLNNLYVQCLADWHRFKDDPMFMVTEMANAKNA